MSSLINNSKISEVMWRVAHYLNAPVERSGKFPNKFVAEKLGVSPSTLSNWMNQKDRKFPFGEIYSFCKENNLSLDFIIDGKEPFANQQQPTQKAPLLDEALKKYEYLASIKTSVEDALEKSAPPETLYENIKLDMDKALNMTRAIKKETDHTPQGYSVG